jgi:hypothetical protein
MNQILHQQRRPASVLSVAALVVTLEKEWNGVDVSVMRVHIEQLPALRAALGEYGKLEVVGTTRHACTVVVWRNDRIGPPTGGGELCRRQSSLPSVAAAFPAVGSEAGAEHVPAGRAAFDIDPIRRGLGRRFSRLGAVCRVQSYRRVTIGKENRVLRIGPFPTDGRSWTVGRSGQSLVAGGSKATPPACSGAGGPRNGPQAPAGIGRAYREGLR